MIVRFLTDQDPKRFILALGAFVVTFFACATAIGAVLDRHELLPPPPLSYTNCIDEKLKFLHELEPGRLENSDILAVGSSTTWRNLDFRAWLDVRPGSNPINGAPCYLHIDQTAYFAGAMLRHMPGVETLLVVLHPRDFKNCRPEYRKFVPEKDLKAYIFDKRPMVLKYMTNFRTGLVRDFITLLTDPRYRTLMEMDRFGSGPLPQRVSDPYEPQFSIDQRCMAFVSELEDTAARAGARLVLVFFPIKEDWADAVDPDRSKHEALYAGIKNRLSRKSTLVINANSLELPKEAFADPVHLLWKHTPAFTEFIAKAIDPGSNQANTQAGL